MSRKNWADNEWLLDPIKEALKIGVNFNICRYCGGRIDPPRRAWCSNRCVFTWFLFSSWRAMRKFVWYRAHKRCELCGIKLTLHKNKTKLWAEIHHIIPVSKGGSDEPVNLVCLCVSCHKIQHKVLEVL